MKRILTAILIFTIMLALGAVPAFATESEPALSATDATGTSEGGMHYTVDADTDATSSEIRETPSETNVTDGSLGNPENEITTDESADPTAGNESDAPGKSGFDEAYSIILKNADKILALLAFLSSVVLGFAYKRGLLPLIKNALSALRNSVTSLKEQSDKAGEEAAVIMNGAAEKLAKAEDVLTLISERISSLEQELSSAKQSAMRDSELRIILSSQIDLLYEIFMSSSLPSYQKDAVGERISEMKRALKAETESE